jgi:hypothetical protein
LTDFLSFPCLFQRSFFYRLWYKEKILDAAHGEVVQVQPKDFSMDAHAEPKKLGIENSGKMMVITSSGEHYLLYRIELDMTVGTGSAQIIGTGLLAVVQLLFGQIHRKIIVYSPEWCAATFKLLWPKDALGTGYLNQLIKY